MILNFQLNFKSETEKSIHTISCIMANGKKPGLVVGGDNQNIIFQDLFFMK
jgi:hypothetical protein